MFAPEITASAIIESMAARASMRPGHVCPGNPPPRRDGNSAAPASMRPGHVCPGNDALGGGGPVRRGRGFNEAGACLPRKSQRRLGRRPLLRRFNEAGACLPRKWRVCVSGMLDEYPASMRPGHVCPGNVAPTSMAAPIAGASMRPGHVCPGNAEPFAGMLGILYRFNEAGACLPRK